MRLNPDCIRAVLVEMEKADYMQQLQMQTIYDQLPKYSRSDIDYSVIKMHEAGLIDAVIKPIKGNYPAILSLKDITYSGHQFLANIREDNIWNDVKGVAKKVGSSSVDAIMQIASNVIAELIKAQFKLSGMQ